MATSSLAKRFQDLTSKKNVPEILKQSIKNTLGETTYKNVPLNYSYPGVKEIPTYDYKSVKTQISTLSNGIRVVSRNTQDPIVNVGVFFQAGSRYCTPDTSGVGHFIESLSLEGTNNITPKRLAENFARTGTTLTVQSYRDAMIYQCETFRKHADFALESLAEIIWNGKIEQYKLKKLRQEYLWRRGDSMKEPEHEIPEYMHQAAYQGNTIGLPLYNDHHTINKITPDVINEFIKIFYQPSRTIVVGVGLEHNELESLANNVFGNIKPDQQYNNLNTEAARYTGGQLRLKMDFNDNQFTHIGLIFETENWKSKDLMSLCVLNMLMGGGGSFSAGGPGKGMYTRLYRDVLGKYEWIHHISCSHSIFDDSGIFCFYGSVPSDFSSDLVGIMIKSAIDMVNLPPTKEELERAKKSLASNICFEFENRQVVFEDLARQVNVFGNHKTPEMWRNEIMAVDRESVIRVAKKLLKSEPTLLALGSDIGKIPNNQEIQDAIKSSSF